METEDQRQFTSCKSENTGNPPLAHLERPALFSALPLPTVSEVLKLAEQLSLKLTPDCALSTFIL